MPTEVTIILYVHDGDPVPTEQDVERALNADVLEYDTEEV